MGGFGCYNKVSQVCNHLHRMLLLPKPTPPLWMREQAAIRFYEVCFELQFERLTKAAVASFCMYSGAKLLFFFHTRKFSVNYLWTHSFFPFILLLSDDSLLPVLYIHTLLRLPVEAAALQVEDGRGGFRCRHAGDA